MAFFHPWQQAIQLRMYLRRLASRPGLTMSPHPLKAIGIKKKEYKHLGQRKFGKEVQVNQPRFRDQIN